MYHPMTGKKTKAKIHKIHKCEAHSQSPWGVTVKVMCRGDFETDLETVAYCDSDDDVTCLKCLDIITRPKNKFFPLANKA